MPSVNGIDTLTPPPTAACDVTSEPAGSARNRPSVTVGAASVMSAAMSSSTSTSAGPSRTAPNEASTSSIAVFVEAL